MLEPRPLRIHFLGVKKQFKEFGKDMLLVVEGDSYRKLVNKASPRKNWLIMPADSKQSVIDACTPIDDEDTIFGLIDQDYDWITNNSKLHNSIVKIDENNIEMMLFREISLTVYSDLEKVVAEYIINCAKEIGILRATCHMHEKKAKFKPLSHENDWFASDPFFNNLEKRDLGKFKKELYISFKEYGKNKRDIDLKIIRDKPYKCDNKLDHMLINGKDLLLLIALAERGESSNIDHNLLLRVITTRLTSNADKGIIRNTSLGNNLAHLDIWSDE